MMTDVTTVLAWFVATMVHPKSRTENSTIKEGWTKLALLLRLNSKKQQEIRIGTGKHCGKRCASCKTNSEIKTVCEFIEAQAVEEGFQLGLNWMSVMCIQAFEKASHSILIIMKDSKWADAIRWTTFARKLYKWKRENGDNELKIVEKIGIMIKKLEVK